MSIVIPADVRALLDRGGRAAAELTAIREGHRRFVVVNGAAALTEREPSSSRSSSSAKWRYRVSRYEVPAALIDTRPGSESLLDYENVVVTDDAGLSASIEKLAGGPVTWSHAAAMDAPR